MPRVIGKVEGRGNGIKTVIFNVVDLSLALKRDPGEVCKFFGTELGAQVNTVKDEPSVFFIAVVHIITPRRDHDLSNLNTVDHLVPGQDLRE